MSKALTSDQLKARDCLFKDNQALAYQFANRHRRPGEKSGQGYEPKAHDRVYQDVLQEALLVLLQEATKSVVELGRSKRPLS